MSWSSTSGKQYWNISSSSGTTNTMSSSNTTFNYVDSQLRQASANSPPSPGSQNQSSGQQCNESKVHDHAEKAVFHGMKSAYRYVSKGRKGVVNREPDEALRIAAHVGRAFLLSKGYVYDPEESLPYLHKNFDLADPEQAIEDAIERAWKKIDDRKHKGGARIAVSLGEYYLEGFVGPYEVDG